MTIKEKIKFVIGILLILAMGILWTMTFDGHWHNEHELTPEQKRKQLYEQCVRASYINGRDIDNCNKINKIYGDNNTISAG